MREPKPILLAEDDARDAELLIEALANSEFTNQVVRVRDGLEALDYLRCRGEHQGRVREAPAVVILDVKMPGMGGIETLRAIRADPELRLLPVVMLSSSREASDVADSYESGSNAYVVKPVRFAELMAVAAQIGRFWARLNEAPPQRGAPP